MSIQRYSYHCEVEQCEAYMQKQIVKKDDAKEEEMEECIACGNSMKMVGIVPYGGYNTFSSLTSAEKKEVLQKRSHDHFNRFIRDKKEQFGKDFTNSVKNLT